MITYFVMMNFENLIKKRVRQWFTLTKHE